MPGDFINLDKGPAAMWKKYLITAESNVTFKKIKEYLFIFNFRTKSKSTRGLDNEK